MITLELPRTAPEVLRAQIGWLNDRGTLRYSEQRHMEHTICTQLKYIESFLDHPDNILREIHYGGVMIGTISAHVDRYNRVADVGILIAPGIRGKGHGYEAWTMFCDTLFDSCNMRRIEGGCMDKNLPMIKLFRKYGMQEEGRRMSHFVFEGSYADLVLYGRFR